VENRRRWNIRIILLEIGFDSMPLPPGYPVRAAPIKSTRDDARNVRKAAAAALAGPEPKEERRQVWEVLHREPDMGVRGQLALVLEAGARGDPLDDWIPLATDPN
jgi:hypothetical protein